MKMDSKQTNWKSWRQTLTKKERKRREDSHNLFLGKEQVMRREWKIRRAHLDDKDIHIVLPFEAEMEIRISDGRFEVVIASRGNKI